MKIFPLNLSSAFSFFIRVWFAASKYLNTCKTSMKKNLFRLPQDGSRNERKSFKIKLLHVDPIFVLRLQKKVCLMFKHPFFIRWCTWMSWRRNKGTQRSTNNQGNFSAFLTTMKKFKLCLSATLVNCNPSNDWCTVNPRYLRPCVAIVLLYHKDLL